MDAYTILQVKPEEAKCRALDFVAKTGDFSERALESNPGGPRQNPSLSKTSSKHAYLIGGRFDAKTASEKCLRYDLEENIWEPMPDL